MYRADNEMHLIFQNYRSTESTLDTKRSFKSVKNLAFIENLTPIKRDATTNTHLLSYNDGSVGRRNVSTSPVFVALTDIRSCQTEILESIDKGTQCTPKMKSVASSINLNNCQCQSNLLRKNNKEIDKIDKAVSTDESIIKKSSKIPCCNCFIDFEIDEHFVNDLYPKLCPGCLDLCIPSKKSKDIAKIEKKEKVLIVQNLPSIDIRNRLVIQTAMQINIKPQKKIDVGTYNNMGYCEVEKNKGIEATKMSIDAGSQTTKDYSDSPKKNANKHVKIRTEDIECQTTENLLNVEKNKKKKQEIETNDFGCQATNIIDSQKVIELADNLEKSLNTNIIFSYPSQSKEVVKLQSSITSLSSIHYSKESTSLASLKDYSEAAPNPFDLGVYNSASTQCKIPNESSKIGKIYEDYPESRPVKDRCSNVDIKPSQPQLISEETQTESEWFKQQKTHKKRCSPSKELSSATSSSPRSKYFTIEKKKKSIRNPEMHQKHTTICKSESCLVSEGEIFCDCKVSNGEMHSCRNVDNVRIHPYPTRENQFDKGLDVTHQKMIYDNWVTYYVRKRKKGINDSSSACS